MKLFEEPIVKINMYEIADVIATSYVDPDENAGDEDEF